MSGRTTVDTELNAGSAGEFVDDGDGGFTRTPFSHTATPSSHCIRSFNDLTPRRSLTVNGTRT